MVDSSLVLKGQTIAYTLYCLVIILVMGWFALARDQGKKRYGKAKAVLHFCRFPDGAGGIIAHHYLQHHSMDTG